MTQNGTVPPARIQFPHHYRTIDPADFRFISGNADIAIVREFMESLPALLA